MAQVKPPRLSVLMAAYNAEEFIERAIEDLLAQSMRDFELVIVEDGSSDGTLRIIEKFAAQDERIVLLRNPENLGLPGSLNRGLETCRAPLVARADADDEYMPDRMERQIRFMDAHPDVGLLSCAVEKIDEEGNRLFTSFFPTEDGEIRMRELFVNCFAHPGAMFRKDLVQQVGGYNVTFSHAQDADLWERLRRRTRAANLNIPLVRYRKHPASSVQSRLTRKDDLGLSVRQRALAHYLERPVSMEEAGSMVDIFWARIHQPISMLTYKQGILGLHEVLAKAKKRETPATVEYYKRQVHDALVLHARWNPEDRKFRLTLLTEAVRWHPRETARRAVKRVTSGVFNLTSSAT